MQQRRLFGACNGYTDPAALSLVLRAPQLRINMPMLVSSRRYASSSRHAAW
jgi:hypothetical protein